MRQILPVAAAGFPIGPAGAGQPTSAMIDALADLYAYPRPGAAAGARPWVRANMIASADGAASLGGRAGGLAGPADRMVFALLRSLADVILVGAGTVRAERYRPVRAAEVWPRLRQGRAPTPPIAVLSRALALDPQGPLLADAPADARTIVLTTEAAPADRQAAAARYADVIVAGQDQVTTAAALGALAARGLTRVLAEGGPNLLGRIAADALLDEICLTFSPLLAGGEADRILAVPAWPGPPARLSLAHVLEDDGYLLCRYLLREPG